MRSYSPSRRSSDDDRKRKICIAKSARSGPSKPMSTNSALSDSITSPARLKPSRRNRPTVPRFDRRHRGLGRRPQLVCDRFARRQRDARHRVDDVLVEARIESEAVFARQIATAVGACAGHRLRSRLSAPSRVGPRDVHLEPALRELVRGREPADAAADDDDARHALLSAALGRTACGRAAGRA